ncbi:MAG: HNH endonuclease signature motif containing protein, partial [Acidimicrobiales bacterium]
MSQAPSVAEPGAAPTVVRTAVDELTAQLCELSGHIHAATGELVDLLGRLEACGGWQGSGIRSIGHWASIYLGIDGRTAAQQARVGRQLADLPLIAAAVAAGELGWSKLRLLARVAEPASQAKWLDLARELSVGQLARIVAAYRRAADADDPDR